jgi:Amt family ammonium transporter
VLVGTSKEPEVEAIDPAATAWLLASMARLLLMTPGVAIFTDLVRAPA